MKSSMWRTLASLVLMLMILVACGSSAPTPNSSLKVVEMPARTSSYEGSFLTQAEPPSKASQHSWDVSADIQLPAVTFSNDVSHETVALWIALIGPNWFVQVVAEKPRGSSWIFVYQVWHLNAEKPPLYTWTNEVSPNDGDTIHLDVSYDNKSDKYRVEADTGGNSYTQDVPLSGKPGVH